MTGDGGDFLRINDLARHTGWLHPAAVAWATYGVVVFGLLLLAGWWLARGAGDPVRTARSLLAPVGMLLAVAVNQPVARLLAEPRPFVRYPEALVLVHRSADPGLPSDHAVMAGAVAVGLLLVDRRLGLLAAGLGVLLAADRVYVGAHFPVDVVAGLLLGAAVAALTVLAPARPVAAVLPRLGRGRVGVLLTG